MPTILLKKSDTASAVPTTANLTNLAGGVEVAVNTADKRMFTMTSESAVVELGTNPSSLTLTGGTANGVLYLNGSKVATSGSALSFTGSLLKVGNPTNAPNTNLSGNLLQVKSSSGFSYLTMGNGDGADNNTYIGSASSITTFGTVTDAGSTSELMRLTSTGLGIGTSSPAYKLDVAESGAPTSTNTFSVARISGSDSVANDLTLLGPNTSQVRIKFGDPESATIGEVGYNHSTNSLRFVTNGAEAGVFDASGSLGLGVTPSAWGTLKAMQVGLTGFSAGHGVAEAYYAGSNAYYDGSNWRYTANGYAAYCLTSAGNFAWQIAPSGTAGNTISFTQAMTLDASGNLGVGATSGFNAISGVETTVYIKNPNVASLYLEAVRKWVLYTGTVGQISFYDVTGAVERGRFTSTGNFLVGTTTDVSGRSGVISDVSGNVRAIPRTGSEKTSAYTLAITDVGQFVQVGTSGSVTVPNDTFATGDVVSVFNNTTGNISLNCPITTAYVGGTNTDRASVTLSTRGVATVLFINPSLCVINGNVS